MNAASSFSALSPTVRLHPLDDIEIAKTLLPAGTLVEKFDAGAEGGLTSRHPGPDTRSRFGRWRSGEPVHRYGQVIGFRHRRPIAPGEHVHIAHNLHIGELHQDYAVGRDLKPVNFYPPEAMRTFEGFLRADGRVGTRNYLAVVSTVNCSAAVSKLARDRFRDVAKDFPNIDGVIAFTHRGGCGLINNGEDHKLLERTLGNMATHPNVAGYVIIGLGCEVNQPLALIKKHHLTHRNVARSRSRR